MGFYVSSLKRIDVQGSVCLWVVYNFQKKTQKKDKQRKKTKAN